MKVKTKNMIGIGLVALSSASAFASGNGAGNGGGAQLCFTNSKMNVEKSLESYDLFQGRKVLRLKIPGWNRVETKEDVLKRVTAKIALAYPKYAQLINAVLMQMNKPGSINDQKEIKLTQIPGNIQPEFDQYCVYKQLVNWYDPGQYTQQSKNIVLRDNSHYESGLVALDPLNQAALDLHESAYKVARFYFGSDFDVNEILQFVAQSFSDGAINEIIADSSFTKISKFNDDEKEHMRIVDFSVWRALDCPATAPIGITISGPSDSEAEVYTLNAKFKHAAPLSKFGGIILQVADGDAVMIDTAVCWSSTANIEINICGKISKFSVSQKAFMGSFYFYNPLLDMFP